MVFAVPGESGAPPSVRPPAPEKPSFRPIPSDSARKTSSRNPERRTDAKSPASHSRSQGLSSPHCSRPAHDRPPTTSPQQQKRPRWLQSLHGAPAPRPQPFSYVRPSAPFLYSPSTRPIAHSSGQLCELSVLRTKTLRTRDNTRECDARACVCALEE